MQKTQQYQTILFPWLDEKTNISSWNFEKDDTGIVMCLGSKHYQIATSTILIIRNIHKSSIPIQLFHLGDEDLMREDQARLSQIPNVILSNLYDYVRPNSIQFESWDTKPFALLFSKFRHVLLMDADGVLLQKPDHFFEHPFYTKTGALFFHDRSMTDEVKNWTQAQSIIRQLVPRNHTMHPDTRLFFNGSTNYLQESGVVLIDRKKHLINLHAVCALNFGFVKEQIHSVTYGEKETYWIGFEMLEADYSFSNHFAGTIGKINDPAIDKVCSRHILHFDFDGEPLWFNGSLRDSNPVSYIFLVAQVWTEEIIHRGSWDWEGALPCLSTSHPKELDPKYVQIIKEGIEILKSMNIIL